jgi:ABC-2 type transport system permease protein
MGKLFAVIEREYLERVRTKWFIIATFLGPIILGALMIVPAWLSTKSKPSADVANIVVLDATATDLGARVVANLGGPLGDTAAARVRTVTSTGLAQAESIATREVVAKQIRGYLVVDSTTLAGIRARYAGRNASSVPDIDRLRSAVRTSVVGMRLERVGVNPSQVEGITKLQPSLGTERITDKGRGGSGQLSLFFALGVAFLLYMLIVLYGQTILRGVMEEKTTRVAEVVVASVSPDTLLAGKVIGVGAVALTQMALWALTSTIVLKLRGPIMAKLGAPSVSFTLPDIGAGMWVAIILFFILGFVFYASLFAAVGSTVNSDQDAQQAATPVTMLVVLAAVFIQPVLLNPGSSLSLIMTRLPFSAPILMPVRMSLVPVPWYELAGVIAGMVVACIAAVWVASRIYRVGLLMYGKRPTYAELSRWVKQSR